MTFFYVEVKSVVAGPRGVASVLITLSCDVKTHIVWSCVTGLRAEHFLVAGLNHCPAPACVACWQVLYAVALHQVNAPLSALQHEWLIFKTDVTG